MRGRSNPVSGGKYNKVSVRREPLCVCVFFFECGEAADARVRVRVRARLASLKKVEKCVPVRCV